MVQLTGLGDFEDENSLEVSLGQSCFKEDSDVKVKRINFKYQYKNRLTGSTRGYIIFNNVYVFCLIKSYVSKKPKYRLDLTFFNSQPEKTWYIAWKLLLVGILFLVATILIPQNIDVDMNSSVMSLINNNLVFVKLVAGIVACVFLWLGYSKSYYQLAFHSFASEVPLLSLPHKFWNKRYRKFVHKLKKGVAYAQQLNNVTLHDRLVGEMQDLRRLKNAGVVNEDTYNEAQSKILTHKHFKS